MTIAFQSEIDPYASAVLRKHWPDTPNLGDCTRIADAPPVDLLCGGFPCTNLSACSKATRTGLSGPESGLFYEFARIAALLQPRWLLIENVSSVSREFAAIQQHLGGWHLARKSLCGLDFGAYTRRKRTFIVGHPRAGSAEEVLAKCVGGATPLGSGGVQDVAPMCLPWKGGPTLERLGACLLVDSQADSAGVREGDGVSRRLDSRRWLAVGNAVVPQVAEAIGRMIMEVDRYSRKAQRANARV